MPFRSLRVFRRHVVIAGDPGIAVGTTIQSSAAVVGEFGATTKCYAANSANTFATSETTTAVAGNTSKNAAAYSAAIIRSYASQGRGCQSTAPHHP